MNESPMGFADLGVPSDLCAVLDRAGITTPFEIQAAVIADASAGRDVAGRAPTGSGKTLAFGLPVVARMHQASRRRPTALILAPTRELAEQIATELRPFVRARGADVVTVYGGVSYVPQRKRLDAGAELVVACPGRLEDLLADGSVDLSDVEQVVIDEADRMADMGFLPSVRRIVDLTSPNRQVLLFSATFDNAISKLSKDLQRDPVVHEVGPEGPDISAATHKFWKIDRMIRAEVTAQAIAKMGSTIVFTRTRHGADRLAKQLERDGVSAAPLHGGLTQRKRDAALRAFQDGDVQSLIATDVAARGVHVDDVAGVVHFDPPEDAATYVHRSGRTARAGASGTVISFVDGSPRNVKRMQRDLGLDVDITPVAVDELVTIERVVKPKRTDDRRRDRNDRSDRPERARRRDDRPARDARGPRFERRDDRRDDRRRDDRFDGRCDDRDAGRRDDRRPAGRNDRAGFASRGERSFDRRGDRPFESRPDRAGRDDRSPSEARSERARPTRETRQNRPGDGPRRTGSVTFFHQDKGYGFIDAGDGPEVFVHYTNLNRGKTLPEGARVEFLVGDGRKGSEAFDVSVI